VPEQAGVAPPSTTAVSAPVIAQFSTDAPVTVQAYYQNTAAAPQASSAVQTSGRDDAFVF
jgi:hypothetical protein